MTTSRANDSERAIAEHHDHGEHPRHVAMLETELSAARAAIEHERERRGQKDREHEEARAALFEAQRRLHEDRQALAQLRGEHQALEKRCMTLSADLTESRRENAVRSTVLSARNRELDDRRRELQAEIAQHAVTRQLVATLEADRSRLADALEGARERGRADAAEIAVLRTQVDQQRVELLAAAARIDDLSGEVERTAERAATTALELSRELAEHAHTRQLLADALATASRARRWSRLGLFGLVGLAAARLLRAR